MANEIVDSPDYRVTETALGTWRRYLYPSGMHFAEFRSHSEFMGLPLVHVTQGICPETGRRITAKGVIAVGRRAVGVVALGQVAAGLLAIGQACIGVLALGQAAAGFIAVGQAAIAYHFGAGQLATGRTAIGQLALGGHVLAQAGYGQHVWSTAASDPEAVSYFRALLKSLLSVFGA